MKGYVHSFESFSTVDGPGIRFVLFLQGCPLRCAYCHNPDTWFEGKGTLYEASELVEKIKDYKNYFKDNGGVTISGGEPLFQIDFVLELVKLLKKENINVCIDTSGFILDKLDELIKYVDLFLLDIKEIVDEKHIEITGKSNSNTLKFAKYLSDNNKDFWIRYVLVPGLTDNMDDILKLKEFANTLKSVKKISVLPYHTLGIHKYEELGIKYRLEGVEAPLKEDVKKIRSLLNG